MVTGESNMAGRDGGVKDRRRVQDVVTEIGRLIGEAENKIMEYLGSIQFRGRS
jgi:hypothetical protein